jgi:hypothetical protein
MRGICICRFSFNVFLEAMDCNNMDASCTKFIKEQEDWHQYHQGQQGGSKDINYNGLVTKIPVLCPTSH